MSLISYIKQLFPERKKKQGKSSADENSPSPPSELCLIGNIVDYHYWGEDKEVKRGTKRFRPNTKVYCLPQYGGMGHERMPVLGLARHSRRLIRATIQSKWIKNYRVKRVYDPIIIEYIRNCYYYSDWIDGKESEKTLHQIAKYFNHHTQEINE